MSNGWKCPVCGAGVAPSVERCPCVTVRPDKPCVDEMVNRFLGWKLPQDFRPDGGILFSPLGDPTFWVTGTNLLTATQAREMFLHVLGKDG